MLTKFKRLANFTPMPESLSSSFSVSGTSPSKSEIIWFAALMICWHLLRQMMLMLLLLYYACILASPSPKVNVLDQLCQSVFLNGCKSLHIKMYAFRNDEIFHCNSNRTFLHTGVETRSNEGLKASNCHRGCWVGKRQPLFYYFRLDYW